MSRIYPLQFNTYNEAINALRKLRKRGARLITTIVIVDVDHWNKVKDLLPRETNYLTGAIVLLVSPRFRIAIKRENARISS